MRPEQIKVGRFYVKKDQSLVREILYEENGKVQWLSYNFPDGSSWGYSSMCQKDHMATWAAREATPEEIARMDRTGALQKMGDHNDALMSRLVPAVLAAISNDDLLEEVRRRRLSL